MDGRLGTARLPGQGPQAGHRQGGGSKGPTYLRDLRPDALHHGHRPGTGEEGFVNRYGQRLDKGRIYKLLHNRVYIGEAVHKGKGYPGEHKAIIPKALWDKVQAILAEAPRRRANSSRAQTPALLKGLIFGPTGRAMSPTHTRRGQKLYRYYVSQSVIKGEGERQPDQPRSRRRDRARRHRPAPHPPPLARDHRRDLACRPEGPLPT